MSSGCCWIRCSTRGQAGRKHAADLRLVVNGVLYIVHTGCEWRFLPTSFGPWTRVWSQFRRSSRNGTWARALIVLYAGARGTRPRRRDAADAGDRHPPGPRCLGRRVHVPAAVPSGGPRRPKRTVAVDVTGLPVGGAGRAVPVPIRTARSGRRSRPPGSPTVLSTGGPRRSRGPALPSSTGARLCTKTAFRVRQDMREGRRLPQDVLTLASHTTAHKTRPIKPSDSHQDHPTLTRPSSASAAVNRQIPCMATSGQIS